MPFSKLSKLNRFHLHGGGAQRGNRPILGHAGLPHAIEEYLNAWRPTLRHMNIDFVDIRVSLNNAIPNLSRFGTDAFRISVHFIYFGVRERGDGGLVFL